MHKVLVVDDSALMRRLLGGVLGDAGYTVRVARNGAEGLQELQDWAPDVVTLDINMPEMDGLTALSLMMQTRPTPVVMVSSLTTQGTQATFEALALGAVDFIAKPGGTISLSIDDIREELLRKVRCATGARVRRPGSSRRVLADTAPPADAAVRAAAAPPAHPNRLNTPARVLSRGAARVDLAPPPSPLGSPRPPPSPPSSPTVGLSAAQRLRAATPGALLRCPGVVLIGVSTGGPRTLEDILPALPTSFPWPIVVAQHMPSHFTEAFARRMDTLCRLSVREVGGTLPLEPGWVYIGRGGTDMGLTERLGRVVVQSLPEQPGHPWHPSVDVLVDSAVDLLPAERLVGVQLTGMGHDGAEAMTRLHQAGGRTIAESEETAVVFGMPQELIQRGGATEVLPCQAVATQLLRWVGRGRPGAPR